LFPNTVKVFKSGITNAFNRLNSTFFQSLSDNVLNFSSSIGNIKSGVQPAINQINQTVFSTVDSVDNSMGNINNLISPYMKIVTLVVTALFAVLLGFGSIGVIGVALMTILSKYGCRRLIFLIAFILFFFGFCTFILSIVFSFITPILYFTCDLIEPIISSNTGFQYYLSEMGVQSDLAENISVCLPGGDGKILSKFIGDPTDGLGFLSEAINKLN
jgi:predicted PurR-regulated permease PerM